MEARQLLIALSLKYNGEWDTIYNGIRNKEQVDDYFVEKAKQVEEKTITIIDNNYPDKLKQINKPPFVLYYNGNVNLLHAHDVIAVSGTRNPTNNSIEAIKNVINDSFEAVLNGGNKGVEEQSALTCKEKNIPIIYVLGESIENFDLKDNDLVISEYPAGVNKNPQNLTNRLRIIAGLCDKLYAMEFNQPSATQMLISLALISNKDVAVLPVEYTSKFTNNQLILEGAEPIV